MIIAAFIQAAENPAQTAEIARGLAENGRVLATLDDWRAIVFVLIGVIIIMAVERWAAAAGMRAERKDLAEERKMLFTTVKEFGGVAEGIRGELTIQQSLSARVESALGRVEKHLDEQG